VTNIPAARWYK